MKEIWRAILARDTLKGILKHSLYVSHSLQDGEVYFRDIHRKFVEILYAMNWPSNFRAGTSTGRDCAAVLALVAKRTPVRNAHVWHQIKTPKIKHPCVYFAKLTHDDLT